MQQTEKYQLNLIERTDPFSPEALNQNTRKVEQVLTAYQAEETAAREAAIADLDARVKVFEAKKLVYGTYNGTGKDQTISLGFTPFLVILQDTITVRPGPTGVVIREARLNRTNHASPLASIADGGFFVNAGSANEGYSIPDHVFIYFALG